MGVCSGKPKQKQTVQQTKKSHFAPASATPQPKQLSATQQTPVPQQNQNTLPVPLNEDQNINHKKNKTSTGDTVSQRSQLQKAVLQSASPQQKQKDVLNTVQDQEYQYSANDAVHINHSRFSKDYTILNGSLGKGAYGQVKRVQHNITGLIRAVKIIVKQKTEKDNRVVNEIKILKSLDHLNIIKIYDVYDDAKYYYIVQELCQGGELFDHLQENENKLSENLVADIMYQILNAVNYLHHNNIVHRDLKPENILIASAPLEDMQLKIIDFGISSKLKDHEKVTSKSGTICYVAPEVLKKKADFKSDIWSCGVIMFFLLSGNLPFTGKSEQQITAAILRGTFTFDSEWEKISKEGKKLIEKMLTYNPAQRPCAIKCIEDNWFKMFRNKKKEAQPLLNNALTNMKDFRSTLKIQQASLMFIVNFMATREEKTGLMTAFEQLDLNHDGKLSKEELVLGYTNLIGKEKAKEEVERIFNQIDGNKSGSIDYSEFVMATIDKKKLLSVKRIEQMFKMIDKDGNGTLSMKEIRHMFGGKKVPEELWKQMIAEIDVDSSGNVSLKEFKEMMFKLT